jgi:O-antigen ligase
LGKRRASARDMAGGPQDKGREVPKRRGEPAKTAASFPPRNLFPIIENAVLGLLFLAVALSFSTRISVNFTLPKLLALRVCGVLLVVCWIYRIKRGLTRPLPRFVFWSGIALVVWWSFTTIFALHKPTAVHGIYGRYNGLLTHGIWVLIFFAVATIPFDLKRLERVLKIFITALVPVNIYAILQFFGRDPIGWSVIQGRSAATIGHPVMLAALIGLALPFVAVFALRGGALYQRTGWAALFFFFLFGAATTLSRGPLIGIILSLIVLTGFALKSGSIPRKWLGIGGLVVILAFGGILAGQGGMERVWKRIVSGLEVNVRILYYRTALTMVKDYPVLGAGFEHFRILYPRYRLPEENEIVRDVMPTMVHNGYLQAALTNGVPGVVLYLVLIGSVLTLLVATFRRETDGELRALLAAFVASITGFIIQDLSGWLEVSLTTFFYIIMGLSVACSGCRTGAVLLAGRKKIGAYAVTCFSVALLACLVVDVVDRIYVDRLFTRARQEYGVVPWEKIESYVTEGTDLSGGDHHYEDAAGLLYMRRFVETRDRALLGKAFDYYEKAHRHNPFDSYVLVHRLEAEAVGVRSGNMEKTSDFGEYGVKRLLEMDRNNPTIYEAIAKLRVTEKRPRDALDLIERAGTFCLGERKHLVLKGDVYIEMGQAQKGVESYRSAVLLYDMKRVGKEYFYTEDWVRTMYGYVLGLARVGQLASSLAEIDRVIALFPGRAQAYLLKAQLYGAMNDLPKARDSFAAALRLEPHNQFAKDGYARTLELLGGRKGPQ